uniref:Uncharacterized protein n=1 Tax=Anguilla anguilla TaxID=7936 RepID=A0A0E9U709_ANGAN
MQNLSVLQYIAFKHRLPLFTQKHSSLLRACVLRELAPEWSSQ